VSLNKELPKTTSVVPASPKPSWNQTFVFELAEGLSLDQQAINIQIFDMHPETTMSRSVGLISIQLDGLLKHHNDVEWFSILANGFVSFAPIISFVLLLNIVEL
jgi:hypothetical protein